VSRREGDELSQEVDQTVRSDHITVGRRRRRDTVESSELEVNIRVSYKTLAVVFLIFNVLGRIVDHLSGSDLSGLSEKLSWLVPF